MIKRRIPDKLAGGFLMVAFSVVAPSIDALAKLLAQELPPVEIALIRMSLQSFLLLPFLLVRISWRELWPMQAHLHFLRGFFIASWTILLVTALRSMPLADAIAIFFVEPLILTLISRIFLGEQVGWRRLAAVAVGFVGALVVIQPSFAEVSWSATLPLGAAFCFASYLALTRKVVQKSDPFAMQFYAGFTAMVILGLITLTGGYLGVAELTSVWPDARAWLLLFCLGFIATCSHIVLVLAFRKAPASLLAPLQYFEIVGATLLGLIIFREFPNLTTWVGIGIIVGSGLYVIWREQKLLILEVDKGLGSDRT